mgnify:CR=1 FL=1
MSADLAHIPRRSREIGVFRVPQAHFVAIECLAAGAGDDFHRVRAPFIQKHGTVQAGAEVGDHVVTRIVRARVQAGARLRGIERRGRTLHGTQHRARIERTQLAAVLRDEIIPLYEDALNETQNAYEQGRYSFLELSTVQAELLAARNELVDASIDAHRHVIEIERYTGLSIQARGL